MLSQISGLGRGKKHKNIAQKRQKKMSRDTLLDPSLPLVSFGDTVATPPLECHVLFEWPLRIIKLYRLYIYIDYIDYNII